MLRYQFEDAFFDGQPNAPQNAPQAADLKSLYEQLDSARAEVLADAELWSTGGEVPADKQPLDAGFHKLPERILAEWEASGAGSELGQIQQVAARLKETVDAVVVLGIGGSYMGARALFEACCHPQHNELPRAQRSGPRLYFAGNGLDNDAAAGVLDIVDACQFQQDDPTDRYAVIVISKSGGTLETAVSFRLFLQHLQQKVGDKASDYIVPVTGESGRLHELATELGCQDIFNIPDGVGGRFSIFCPVGLLPAAVLGVDPVELLRGAVRANERFASAGQGENPTLDYVGVSRLWEQAGADIRILSVWADGLEATGLWYDQLLAESLGKDERGPTPLTVVNTRDLHSRGQQHQEGQRDKLVTNLTVEKFSAPTLELPASEHDQDKLNDLSGTLMPTMLQAAIDGTNQAYRDVCRPTATFTLPAKNADSLGEFLQTMMLATVLEGRLIDINPYGQPGVEAYKRNMNAILRGK